MSVAPSQVVVGYDGSDRARKALEAVRRIAAPGAKVEVIYANRVPPELTYYEFFEDVLAELDRGAQAPCPVLVVPAGSEPEQPS